MANPRILDDGRLASGIALIGLGANLPWRGRAPAQTLADALAALGCAGVAILAKSRIRQTLAWPDPSEPPFANAAALVDFEAKDADAALALLHAIEACFGRRRNGRNTARTLDLDLLDFAGELRISAGLVLPHPRLAGRRFALEPIRDIAPAWRHPALGRTADELLADLADENPASGP